jgi:ABC-type phosphate/phosphonate transport system permease subunit
MRKLLQAVTLAALLPAAGLGQAAKVVVLTRSSIGTNGKMRVAVAETII